jgi:hypothetical protein
MNTAPQPPFSTDPIDFNQPVECKRHQLPDVLAAATRAGYQATRMSLNPLGYRVTFQRKPEQTVFRRVCERCLHWLFTLDEFGQCSQQRDAMTASTQTCGMWQPRTNKAQR